MGRIRTTKPEYYRHEGLFEAERTTGLPLRVAYSGLFTVADREGRFRWKPRVLKLDVLPFDDLDFEHVLVALEKYGFIRRYEVGGESFGYIPTFLKHQVINQREAQSAIPAPPDHNSHVQAQESHGQKPERTCMHVQTRGEVEVEGKGKGKEKSNAAADAAAVFVLPDWIPKETWDAFCKMRQRIRKPLTDEAKKLTVGDLEKLKTDGEDIKAVLEKSVKRSWAGVFSIKEGGGNGRRPTGAIHSDRRQERAPDHIVV